MLIRSCETLPALPDQNHLARFALLLKYWLAMEAVVSGAAHAAPVILRVHPNLVSVKLTVGSEVLSLVQPVPIVPTATPVLAPVFSQTHGPEPTKNPLVIESNVLLDSKT